MKNNLKNWRSVATIVGIFMGLAIAPVSRVFADNQTTDIFSPDKNVFGKPYGDWSAAWWQWVLTIPAATNPLNDTTGANCAVGQSSGPVFFLVGSFVGTVNRICTVPRDKAVYFPIINAECSTVEQDPFHGNNEAELRTCAGKYGDAFDVRSLKLTVDGQQVKGLKDYRAQSPVFNFTLPVVNILGVYATIGSSVDDGYYVMLKSLKPGNHTIHFEGACKRSSFCYESFSQDVTYYITVPR